MANGRSDGSVIIDTLVDTRGFGKGVNNMERQMGGLTGAINKLGLAIAATFGIRQLVKFGKSAIELGSDLEEVQNVVDVTFTSMSENVNEFAKGAAEAAGLSETMAKRYVGTFGAMAKAFGFAEGEAFNMSTSLTQLAGDVASFYNLTQDEAYTKLKSVFTGETETLKDLGVVMTQNALDSYAMAKGYGKTTKAMSEQEKVALRYSFVLDQLSAAQGDFVRTSDSWANQTRILSLNFDTFKANIGKALINIFTPFLKVLNQLVAKLAQLSQHFVAFSELLVGKSISGGGGSPGDALEGIEEGYENIADATDKATKAQNKYLTGLDEIRTFAESDALEDSSGLDFSQIEGSSDAVKNEVNDTTDLIANLENRFPKLIQVLRDSLGKIKEIFNDFKVGDFFAAGQDISQLVTGIYNFVSEAIDAVEWEKLGKEIGNFLAGIEWLEIIKGALKLKVNIWKAIAEVWLGAFETAPFETAFITAIAAMKFLGLGNVLSNAIIAAIPSKIFTSKTITISGLNASFASLISSLSIGGSMGGLGTPAFDVIGTKIWDLISDGLEKMIPQGAFDFLSKLGAGLVAGAVGGSWFPGVGTVAGAIIGAIVAALNSIKIDGKSVFANIVNSLKTGFEFLWKDTISEFEAASYWFEKIGKDFEEKDWLGIGKDILMGIVHGFVSFISIPIDPFKRLFEWIWDGICNIFGIHSPAKEMMPIGEYILLGVINGFESAITNFKNVIGNLLDTVKSQFSDGFKGVANVVIGYLNNILQGIENMVNNAMKSIAALAIIATSLTGVKVDIPTDKLTIPKIPYLASGAVIPPNAPFMAVLGDQRHGTNIEAPLDTIKQAVREVIGNGNGGRYQFTAQLNRRTLFDEFIEEAKLRQSTTGRNPLDLT